MQNELSGFFKLDPPPGGLARLRTAIRSGDANKLRLPLLLPANRKRAGKRVVLLGAVAILAAVAAMLALRQRPAVPVLTDSATPIVEALTAPSIIDTISTEPATEILPAVTAVALSTPLFTVRVVPPVIMTDAQLDALDLPDETRELIRERLHASTSDPAKRRAVQDALQSLYAALIEELRKVPGVVVVASDPEVMSLPSLHYQLKITYTVNPFDRLVVPQDSRYTGVNLDAEQLQPGGNSIRRLNIATTIDAQAACSGAAPVADTPCTDARGTATTMVHKLRQDIFEDATLVRSMLRDTSRNPTERLKTFAELVRLQARTGDTSLLRDPEVVRAAIELAAATTDAALRAQVWRSMRGVGNTSLVEPLIASLVQDSNEVRLAAAETLGADFRADPRARSALEIAAVGDARALVRAVAERGLSGEEGWRRYVITSLKDANLPASQRVEALVYYLYPPGPAGGSSASNPDYWQIMEELLDDGSLPALAEALPKAGRLRGNIEGNLLANIGTTYKKNPAVTKMLLDYLEHDAVPRNRATAGTTLARSHGSEPRVRDALNKALSSDPDQSVRDGIRQAMGDKTP